MSKNYKQTYLWLWVLLAVALAVVCAISFTEDARVGNIELTKGTFPDVILAPEQPETPEAVAAEEAAATAALTRTVIAETDTTVKTVLIFGDSMTVLVANRLAAYGEKNGFRVVSVTWDASSSISWSGCDTLDNFIARYRPDFIMVTLGSNELFLKNFDKRRPYVEKLVEKMAGIPFVWIGPPNWKEDVGFNAMMTSTLPAGTYFDSNNLDLPRGRDHIHPTPQGGITWTDSIMSWMAFTPHPIPSVRPDAGTGTRKHEAFYYKAASGKGGGKTKQEAPQQSDAAAPEPQAAPQAEAAPAPPAEHPAPNEAQPQEP